MSDVISFSTVVVLALFSTPAYRTAWRQNVITRPGLVLVKSPQVTCSGYLLGQKRKGQV